MMYLGTPAEIRDLMLVTPYAWNLEPITRDLWALRVHS